MPVKPHFFILALAVFAGLFCAAVGDIKPSGPAPLAHVEFYDKSEKAVSLKDFKGKVTLVNLWASWCTPCIGELPALQRLGKKLPEGFALVVLSLDTTSMKEIRAFLASKKITLESYWDKDRQIPMNWKYKGLPTSFLIDARGHLIKQYDGVFAWDTGATFDEIRALVNAHKPS